MGRKSKHPKNEREALRLLNNALFFVRFDKFIARLSFLTGQEYGRSIKASLNSIICAVSLAIPFAFNKRVQKKITRLEKEIDALPYGRCFAIPFLAHYAQSEKFVSAKVYLYELITKFADEHAVQLLTGAEGERDFYTALVYAQYIAYIKTPSLHSELTLEKQAFLKEIQKQVLDSGLTPELIEQFKEELELLRMRYGV